MTLSRIIIDDNTGVDLLIHPDVLKDPSLDWSAGRGFQSGMRPRGGFMASLAAEPMPASLIVDPSEFQARIQERTERKSSLRDICTRFNIPPMDQQQTNYCWANAPTYTIEVLRAVMNEVYVPLSAASIAAPLTGYRNQGGFGQDALQRIVDVGIVPESLWPHNAISKQYATAANFTEAAKYRATGWIVPDDQNVFNLCIGLVLLNIPVAVGYNWWSHEITWADVVWLDGQAWPVIRNSWGTQYGDNGYATIQGNRATPSDACAPILARAA